MASDEAVRVRLAALRDELRTTLIREREDLEQPADDPLDRTGQHPADAGTDLYLREWSLTTQRTLQRELAAIDDALGRIDHGTYGMCVECGRPIEPERLAVRPQAIRRLECEHRYRTSTAGTVPRGRSARTLARASR